MLSAHFLVITGQYKLILYDNGRVYSWGVSSKGCLGLGHNVMQTKDQMQRIKFKNDEKDEFITEIKAGRSHVLALTKGGEIYAWGDNSHSQVGIINRIIHRSKKSKKDKDKDKNKNIIWSPNKVYPPCEVEDQHTYK